MNTSAHNPDGSNYVQAVEFTLDWCVATFNTSVNSGVAVTSRTKHPLPYYRNSSENARAAARALGHDLILRVNETAGDHIAAVDYRIDDSTHATMQRYLFALFSGSSRWDSGASSGGGIPIVPASDEALIFAQAVGFREGLDYSETTKTVAEGLTNLKNILDNVATSMTNYHREQGKPQANGTSFSLVPIVVVRWGYVAAPITFCILNVVFFVTMATGCYVWRRGPAPPVWKSSVVPLLRLMDPKLQEQLGCLVEGDERSAGHGLKPRLVADGKGWQLRVAEDDLKACHDEYPLTQIPLPEDEGAT